MHLNTLYGTKAKFGMQYKAKTKPSNKIKL